MKTETKSYRAKYAIKSDTPKIKTLDMQLDVTHRDLSSEVRRAFALAKSTGQELNLMFSHATA